MSWNDFRGAAKRIEDADLPRIGHSIGVGEDELHAFMDVEAAGSGFDGRGRPKMLFEPHVFYRNLSGSRRTQAVSRGLAYKNWRRGSYPADSYPRLERAMTIDETAALRSASWGLGQILGENHAMCGHATPQSMVRTFMADEDEHLRAMVAFLVASGIDDDMRRLASLDRPTRPSDCVPIVRVYNGPGYAKNSYHVKFADAHNKWRRIPDTPWVPGDDVEIVPIYDPGDEAADAAVRYYQEALARLGYYGGEVDGLHGPKTEAAVRAFQSSARIAVDGDVGSETISALERALENLAAGSPAAEPGSAPLQPPSAGPTRPAAGEPAESVADHQVGPAPTGGDIGAGAGTAAGAAAGGIAVVSLWQTGLHVAAVIVGALVFGGVAFLVGRQVWRSLKTKKEKKS